MLPTDLRVPGMDCEHCEQVITGLLKDMDGVSDVASDVDSRRLSFKIDPAKTSLQAVRERLVNEGYPPDD